MNDSSIREAARRMQYAGAEWAANCLRRELTPFESVVADILGAAWQGIYHLEDTNHGVSRGKWRGDVVEVVFCQGLATYDFDWLTALVVLAHDSHTRLEIRPVNFHNVRLTFSQRKRSGDTFERHPTMESAMERVRMSRADLREPAKFLPVPAEEAPSDSKDGDR